MVVSMGHIGRSFNIDANSWDVGNVTDMENMFYGQKA